SRGELLWQGQGNAFAGNRLKAFLALTGGSDEPARNLDAWQQFWGSAGEQRHLLVEVPSSDKFLFSAEAPRLERLALPPKVRPVVGEALPGANLVQLGILAKTK